MRGHWVARERAVRILSLSKSTGGLASYNRALCAGLRRLGHDVEAICLSDGAEAYAADLRKIGVEASAWPMARYRIAPLADAQLARRLIAHLRDSRCEVLIGHGAKAGLLARLAGRASGTPSVYAMHSQPFLSRVQGRMAPAYGAIERAASTMLGGRTVVLCESMRASVVSARIAAADQVSVIYSGIDPGPYGGRDPGEARAELGLAAQGTVVGWAGRLTAQKAPERFVDLAARIGPACPDTQFVLVGDGIYATDPVPDRLVLLPWQQDPGVLYSACDIYVLTSRWEGLPLALLEAMASGCAVVALAVDGVAEAIRDGVDGLLCPAPDTDCLAACVERLVNDPDRRRQLGRSAQARVRERFTEAQMVQAWERLLRAEARP